MYQPTEDSIVCVRLLRPGFQYPERGFKHQDALYYVSEDASFIVTKYQSSNYDSPVITEVAIWLLEEIRLLSALTLSVPEGGGMPAFAPWHISEVPDIPLGADLSSDSIILSCLGIANGIITEQGLSTKVSYNISQVYRSDIDVETSLFENIDLKDDLLMRGLYTLLKSRYLINVDFCCMEEAFINLQISFEAALQIIRGHLQYLGNPNPSYEEAYNYIRSNFKLGKPLIEHLDMQYESWVTTKHPLSKYGALWGPSIWVGDIYDTSGCLVSIYRHIVLGEPGRSSLLF